MKRRPAWSPDFWYKGRVLDWGNKWHNITRDPENKLEPKAHIGKDGINRYPFIIEYTPPKGGETKKIRVHNTRRKDKATKTPSVADGSQQEYRLCKSCIQWVKFPDEMAIYGQPADERKQCKECQIKTSKRYRDRNKMAAIGVRTELEKRDFAEKFVAYNGDVKKVFEELGILYKTNKEWAVLADEETAQYIRETQAKKNQGLFFTQLDLVAEAWKIIQNDDVSAKDKAPYFKLLAEVLGATGKAKEVQSKAISGKTTNNIQIINYSDTEKNTNPVIEQEK